mmetsp:Transcript_30101/g.48238  ORF Transcript_30101/g.48238 Transcript_30101/m.48238 type:complete len:102 (+) Transcript_30101:389-694(+)
MRRQKILRAPTYVKRFCGPYSHMNRGLYQFQPKIESNASTSLSCSLQQILDVTHLDVVRVAERRVDAMDLQRMETVHLKEKGVKMRLKKLPVLICQLLPHL